MKRTFRELSKSTIQPPTYIAQKKLQTKHVKNGAKMAIHAVWEPHGSPRERDGTSWYILRVMYTPVWITRVFTPRSRMVHVLAGGFPYNVTQRHPACVSGGGGPSTPTTLQYCTTLPYFRPGHPRFKGRFPMVFQSKVYTCSVKFPLSLAKHRKKCSF